MEYFCRLISCPDAAREELSQYMGVREDECQANYRVAVGGKLKGGGIWWSSKYIGWICKDKVQAESWFIGLRAVTFRNYCKGMVGSLKEQRGAQSCINCPAAFIRRKQILGLSEEKTRSSQMHNYLAAPLHFQQGVLLTVYHAHPRAFIQHKYAQNYEYLSPKFSGNPATCNRAVVPAHLRHIS
ncbi:hypothetical protein Pfo_001752 [Paulownia fortunei]|nr:hypothetical protein Pfo_001752 [Paulownia fortunei]